MDTPVLSIYVATYNHENYICQALDSILMQETKYSYEVLVGEDCSADNTRAVLKDYERQHPGKFTIFYREHNMHREPIGNAKDLKMRCRGKYIIALEGDDYWTDPHKLEKQIDFLEEHPEYIAVSHNCTVVDHNGQPKEETYPECKEEEYTLRHFFREIMPGQLATVMYRNMYADSKYDRSIFDKKLTPGDRVVYFWLLLNGRVHCIQECMSAYRHVTDRGSSYSATTTYCFKDYNQLYESMLQYARKMCHREGIRTAELLLVKNLMNGLKHRQCRPKDITRSLGLLDHPLRIFGKCILWKIRQKILHTPFWI